MAGPGCRESTVNRQLLDLQKVLTYERQRCPQIVGSSVFSLDDVYVAWKRFVECRRACGNEEPLYFVKVDIENCYNSINQSKLLDILATVLRDSYVVRRYVMVVEIGGRLRRTFHRDATCLADYQPNFVHYIRDQAKQHGSHDAFFIDQVSVIEYVYFLQFQNNRLCTCSYSTMCELLHGQAAEVQNSTFFHSIHNPLFFLGRILDHKIVGYWSPRHRPILSSANFIFFQYVFTIHQRYRDVRTDGRPAYSISTACNIACHAKNRFVI